MKQVLIIAVVAIIAAMAMSVSASNSDCCEAGLIRYAEDKPKSCEYCYFWNEKKKECRQMRCFYQLPEKPPDPDPAHRFWVPCKGCPYGRNPCIGYCMAKILKEQRKKQSG